MIHFPYPQFCGGAQGPEPRESSGPFLGEKHIICVSKVLYTKIVYYVNMKALNYRILLKEYRAEAGLTQKQVADLLETSQQNYQRYESGQIEPNIATLICLARIFGTTVDELFQIEEQ